MIGKFQKIFSRRFSQKVFQATAKKQIDKVVCKVEKEKEQEIENPVASILGLLSTCEIKSILFFAKKENIDIQDINISVIGNFDFSNFHGSDLSKPNTYQNINCDVLIKSTEKDMKKLKSIVDIGIEKCPVGNTLKLAGVSINHNVNYI